MSRHFPELVLTGLRQGRGKGERITIERHFKQPQLPAEKEKEDKTELLKSPTIAEFLGFKQDESYRKKHRKQFIIFTPKKIKP